MAVVRMTLVMLLAAQSAQAQTKVGEATMMALEGVCETLVVGARALGAECSAKILNVSYPDGRVSFYFVLTDGRIVAFSGMDGENPTPDSDVVDLDQLIVSRADTPDKPDVTTVRGTCGYGNPYKGAMTVRCEGSLDDGHAFSAVFTTDGNPPT